MALFASNNFYQPPQPQNISAPPASNFFNFIPNSNIPLHLHQQPTAMKRRRGIDESSEPLPKRKHYEERISQRLDSIDINNEAAAAQPQFDLMDDDDISINEIDPEILDVSPQSFSEDVEKPIIEEPDDEDKIVLSAELHRYMKQANENSNIFSKFHTKKQGNELVLWRPLSSILPDSSSSGNQSSSSLNDRITEVVDEEGDQIQNGNEGFAQSHVTFPDESSSSSSHSASASPTQILDTDPIFSPLSSSSSSSSCDAPTRMFTSNISPPNQTDYEPMEMD